MFEFVKTFMEDIQKKALEKQERFNNYISSINEEIVKNSSFIPLKRGWTNIKSHDLIIENNWNYLFKVKWFFPEVFLGIFFTPIITTIIILYSKNFEVNNMFWEFLWLIIYSIIFSWLAWLIFYSLHRSYIFDFQNWYFYDTIYTQKLFEFLRDEKYKNKIISLKEIQALQIISERVHGKNTTYTSYELNMILKNSSRVNIIDHWNLEEIRKNASELANKLWVKVYDITEIYVENFY